MSEMFRVGIAGYGIVGKRRRLFIDHHPRLQTVAICDRDFSEGDVLDDGVRCYKHYERLLNESLDILFVCLPNDMAPVVTIAGLEKELHVFCEKPPGKDLADVARVISCERHHPQLKLKYGFNHRYHDSVKEALQIVRSNNLGQVINIRGVYGKSRILSFARTASMPDWRTRRESAGGGILLDQGIHMVDMMRLFAGEFTDVHSFVSNGYWNYDVEDNAYALMRTADGVVAMLHSSATQWRHRFQMEITLWHGMIILSGILSGTKSYDAETLTVARVGENDRGDPRELTTRYNKDNSWRDEINEFADAIVADKRIVNGSSDDALKTMKLVYQIYCADQQWSAKYNLSDDIPQHA